MSSTTIEGGNTEPIDSRIPDCMLKFLLAAGPKSQEMALLADLLGLKCGNNLQYASRGAWQVAQSVARAIGEAKRNLRMYGELGIMLIAIWVHDPRVPLLPLLTSLLIIFFALRLRDAYAHPAKGTLREVLRDSIASIGFLIVCELAFNSVAPRLALLLRDAAFASSAAIFAANWRLLIHREDPPEDIRRNFLKRKVAVYHANFVFLAAGAPLILTSVKAVPVPGRVRDVLVAFPLYIFPVIALRLKKSRYLSPKDGRFITLDLNIPQMEVDKKYLKRQLAFLPVRDHTGKLPKDVFAEAAFFMLLACVPLEAAWRWVSHSPSAASVDWRQIYINSGALVVLVFLWLQIRRLNYKLAADLRKAIHDLEARRADEQQKK